MNRTKMIDGDDARRIWAAVARDAYLLLKYKLPRLAGDVGAMARHHTQVDLRAAFGFLFDRNYGVSTGLPVSEILDALVDDVGQFRQIAYLGLREHFSKKRYMKSITLLDRAVDRLGGMES